MVGREAELAQLQRWFEKVLEGRRLTVFVTGERGLLMAFKLLDMAQQRWRRLDGAALLPLVRAGVKFVDGVKKSVPTTNQPNEAAPREAA